MATVFRLASLLALLATTTSANSDNYVAYTTTGTPPATEPLHVTTGSLPPTTKAPPPTTYPPPPTTNPPPPTNERPPPATKPSHPKTKPPPPTTKPPPPTTKPPPKECGIVYGRRSNRIVGGKEVAERDHPCFFISLVAPGDIGDTDCSPNCGGTLISSQYVLTAAHCFRIPGSSNMTKDEDKYIAIANMWNRCNMTNHLIRRIIKVFVYPWFKKDTLENDMAIAVVETPFPSWCGFCCLTLGCLEDLHPVEVKIIGFGLTATYDRGGDQPCIVNEIVIDTCTAEETKASKIYPYVQNNEDAICAGCANDGKDACQGDSGGPMFVVTEEGRHYCIAVVSFGISCADKYPGVYSCVTSNQDKVDWIRKIIATPF